jgi:hypothetical protein
LFSRSSPKLIVQAKTAVSINKVQPIRKRGIKKKCVNIARKYDHLSRSYLTKG